MFIAPMDSPGLRVQPLIGISGTHHFNQVFFDEVRIPRENLIGEENRGWYQMATTLDFERSSIVGAADTRRSLEDLVEFCKAHRRDGRPLIADAAVRNKLADLAVELRVTRVLGYRLAAMAQAGKIPNSEASIAKVFAFESAKRLAHVGLEILGLYGPIQRGSRWAALEGQLARTVNEPCGTIAGGTSEIQRNIIAQRGLGLPR
jgi:alkylation response protein AidB-like acyl-CoA dehydrogenase